MFRKIFKCLVCTLLLCVVFSASVFADEAPAPSRPIIVRVNGDLVEFPDGQPYVDENGRTMIPVRFVSEKLEAKVSWDNVNRIVIIQKDNIYISLPVGKATFQVTTNGVTKDVTMDTEAVLSAGRTYVPIRYVAESLGAYVDYSNEFKAVGIYTGVFTAEEMDALRSYGYTQPRYAVGYKEAKEKLSEKDLAYRYGTHRDSFAASFANAHEYLYQEVEHNGEYSFKELSKIVSKVPNNKFYELVVQEACEELSYSSVRLDLSFRADTSCIYQADNADGLTLAVRGFVVAKLHVKPTELNAKESLMLSGLGYMELSKGEDLLLPVDVHMNTKADSQVNAHTTIALR